MPGYEGGVFRVETISSGPEGPPCVCTDEQHIGSLMHTLQAVFKSPVQVGTADLALGQGADIL